MVKTPDGYSTLFINPMHQPPTPLTAVEAIIAEGKHVTYDLAPAGVTPVGTQEMAQAIAARINA